MNRFSRCVLLALALAGFLQAQGTATMYFSTRFAETPASGRGGDINGLAAPCNPLPTFGPQYVIESAVANSPGVQFVHPGVVNSTEPYSMPPGNPFVDYVEVVNFPQFNLIIGDLDGDGIPNESSNFRGCDALWLPFAATSRPNNVHEFFMSASGDSTGSSGYIQTGITEADMVLLPSATNPYGTPSTPESPVFFIRQSDWTTLFGFSSPQNGIDVDAFTVDPATGDIYASFAGTSSGASTAINGAMVKIQPGGNPVAVLLQAGDIVRIPAAAYTPSGPYGVVTNPVSGFAERVLTAPEVASLVSNAGGSIQGVSLTDVTGLDFDPNATAQPYTTTSGFQVPNLLFTVDNRGGSNPGIQNMTAPAVYSTAAGGTYAVLNGVTMNNPNAAGIRDISFNPNFYCGPLDALSVVFHSPTLDPLGDRPLHLDSFPDAGLASPVPQQLTLYISGAAPNTLLAIFARVDFVPAGGFLDRYDVSFLAPNVSGFPDLYVDIAGLVNQTCVITPPIFFPWCQNPGLQSIINGGANPIITWVDPVNGAMNGDTCFELSLPPAPATNPPALITLQALDLTNFRLSSPFSFQFN